MLIKNEITTQLLHIIYIYIYIYIYSAKNTIHTYDNRRSFISQQNHFTYQRKGNQELQIQLSNTKEADLQSQIHNLSSSNQPPDDDPEIGYA